MWSRRQDTGRRDSGGSSYAGLQEAGVQWLPAAADALLVKLFLFIYFSFYFLFFFINSFLFIGLDIGTPAGIPEVPYEVPYVGYLGGAENGLTKPFLRVRKYPTKYTQSTLRSIATGIPVKRGRV